MVFCLNCLRLSDQKDQETLAYLTLQTFHLQTIPSTPGLITPVIATVPWMPGVWPCFSHGPYPWPSRYLPGSATCLSAGRYEILQRTGHLENTHGDGDICLQKATSCHFFNNSGVGMVGRTISLSGLNLLRLGEAGRLD